MVDTTSSSRNRGKKTPESQILFRPLLVDPVIPDEFLIIVRHMTLLKERYCGLASLVAGSLSSE